MAGGSLASVLWHAPLRPLAVFCAGQDIRRARHQLGQHFDTEACIEKRIPVLYGIVMTVSEYLRTRLVELGVHLDDLDVSTGGEVAPYYRKAQDSLVLVWYRRMAMSLRVPEDLDRRLDVLAAEEHTSKSALLLQGA